MGCGSSRSVSAIEPRPGSGTKSMSSTKSIKNNKVVPNADSRVKISKDNNDNIIKVSPNSSLTNMNNFTKRREISASSTRTADSGISELEDGGILTENSDPNKLEQIQASERPETPDLTLQGSACPRLQSGKEKRRLELEKKNSDSSIPKLPPLGNGRLLERPKTRGGEAFDIILFPETGNIKKTPANLPKLEARKRRKRLTKDELDEKMKKASQRRQEHNKRIIEKSQAFLAHSGYNVHAKSQLEQNIISEEDLKNSENGQEPVVTRSNEERTLEDYQ